MARIDGRWEGRLLDAAGFEGVLSFQLKASRGKVSGTYDMALITQHGDAPRRGNLSGAMRKGHIELALVPEAKPDPKVSLKGDVFFCGDGLGLKGTYTVEPRKFSPLVSGIVVMSTEGARVADEEVVHNPSAEQPSVRKTARRTTRRTAR